MGLVKDAGERKKAEEKPQLGKGEIENKISESMILEIIMTNSQDTIYFKDRNSRFIANSKAHASQFGFENPKEMIGLSDFDLFAEEFAVEAYADEKRIMESGVPILGKTEKCVSNDGTVAWFSASKYPIMDENNEVIGTWGISRNITALKSTQEELTQLNTKLEETNQKLKELSDIDGLSKLFNQRKFHEVLEETVCIHKRKRELGVEDRFCVVLMDIDSFKNINDQYGHPIGDQAIRFVADILSRNKRESDICFRFGGDEFAMILQDTSREDGVHIAERLRRLVEDSIFKTGKKEIHMTISVGVAQYSGEESARRLLSLVDKKLYISKNNGKNQVN